MSEEVTKIIETLCQKLGVAASVLVPELAKYNIARLAVASAFGLLITAWLFAITHKLFRKHDDDFEAAILTALFPGLATLILTVATCMIIVDLVGWIASPTASAVMEITSMIK